MNKIRLSLLGLLFLTIVTIIFIKIYTVEQANNGKARPGVNKPPSSTLPSKTQDIIQQDSQPENQKSSDQTKKTKYKGVQSLIRLHTKKTVIPEEQEGIREIISILRDSERSSAFAIALVIERFKCSDLLPPLIELYNNQNENIDDTTKQYILYLIGMQADDQAKSFLVDIFRTSQGDSEKRDALEGLYILTLENKELISADRAFLSEMINSMGNIDTISLLGQSHMIGILCASGVSDIISTLKNCFWREVKAYEIATVIHGGIIPVFRLICSPLLFHDPSFAQELYQGFITSNTEDQLKILHSISSIKSWVVNRVYKDEEVLKKQWAPLSDFIDVALQSNVDEIREQACSELSSYEFLITPKIREKLEHMKNSDPNKEIRKQCTKLLKKK